MQALAVLIRLLALCAIAALPFINMVAGTLPATHVYIAYSLCNAGLCGIVGMVYIHAYND